MPEETPQELPQTPEPTPRDINAIPLPNDERA